MNAIVMLVLSSLVSTGAASTQGSTTQAYDGCAFISVADVEAVSGEKVRGRPRVVRRTLMSVESDGCTYRGETFTVEVRLETGRDREGLDLYLKMLGATVKQTTSSALKPVTGLGDKAWWGPINPTNGILHIVKGTDVLTVQTYGKGPGAGSLEKTRAIAEKVFGQYQRVRK